MNSEATLVRFSEVGLKGRNRPEFERILKRNIRRSLRHLPGTSLVAMRGRYLVRHPGSGPRAVAALRHVCGVKSVSPVVEVGADWDSLRDSAVALLGRCREQRPGDLAFAVRARRADKSYPRSSGEVERELGRELLTRFPDCRVQLEQPAVEIGVEIRPEGSFVFAERLAGPGGLPVGSTGHGIALLSGGIDSPVAAFLAMKRGLRLDLLFFHSPEFTGTGPLEKVRRLAAVLSPYQPRSRLLVVPFAEVQVAIKERCAASYRTLLYRRMMHRIADRLCPRPAAVLVTGDSLGQVASQTLENLALTAEATRRQLLRPLIALDKEETVVLAKALGSYPISIEREPDCCTLFQPDHPRTRGAPAQVRENEARLPLAALVEAAAAGCEGHEYFADGTSRLLDAAVLSEKAAAPSSGEG